MEDSSNEKVKHEKQRRNIIVYAFWSVCIYIAICLIYVLSYLSILFFY